MLLPLEDATICEHELYDSVCIRCDGAYSPNLPTYATRKWNGKVMWWHIPIRKTTHGKELSITCLNERYSVYNKVE